MKRNAAPLIVPADLKVASCVLLSPEHGYAILTGS